MNTEFPTVLKEFRLEAGFGLREFAELVGEHPSNYAGVESGQRPIWRDREKMRKVVDALGLEEGSAKWDRFYLAASESRGLPPDVRQLLERPMMLALLRTVEEQQLDEEQLKKLVEYVRKKFKAARK